jgi:hypothetical protein
MATMGECPPLLKDRYLSFEENNNVIHQAYRVRLERYVLLDGVILQAISEGLNWVV